MPKSKNEIRERNGKLVLLTILILPFVVYFGIWGMLNKAVDSFVESINTHRKTKKPRNKIRNDTLPYFMESRYSVFVGSSMENKEHIVQGFDFSPVDSFTVEYKYTKLVDWKRVEEKVGCAQLLNKNDKIKYYNLKGDNGELMSAYRLEDLDDACNFHIYITKTDNITTAKAKIFEKCENQTKPVTPLMYSK